MENYIYIHGKTGLRFSVFSTGDLHIHFISNNKEYNTMCIFTVENGKYELETDELFDRSNKKSFICSEENSVLFISFSGRENGNCNDIAQYLATENDKLVLFKDIFYNKFLYLFK